MPDIVRFLKVEAPPNSTNDMGFPTEANPLEDYGAIAGVYFLGNTNLYIESVSGSVSGTLRFRDIDTSNVFTLRDLGKRLNLRNVSDAAPSGGNFLIWDAGVSAWAPKPLAIYDTGVTPPFFLSYTGNLGNNSYFRIGEVSSNQGGLLLPGLNRIAKLTLTSSQADNQSKTVQIRRRTGVSTFVNIPGATITIPGNNVTYSAVVTGLSINIGPDWEIAAVNSGPGNLQNPVLGIYVTPQ